MRPIGIILTLIILAGISGGGYFLWAQNKHLEFKGQELSPLSQGEITDGGTNVSSTSSATSTGPRKDIFSFPGDPNAAQTENSAVKKTLPASGAVTYTAQGWSPAVVSVRLGGVVTFSNKSGHDFEPAFDPQSGNMPYPEFDAKTPVASGASWKFTFDKKGTWGYSDRLNPSLVGVIIVE